MKLYYAPGACSLAPHILAEELGMNLEIEKVDLRAGTYAGGDFKAINPKGYVPVLALSEGQSLTEVAVILQYLADQKPEAGFLPAPGSWARYQALEWLNFIATEVHKGFGPLWNPQLPAEVRDATLKRLSGRYDFLNAHLSQNAFVLGDHFSVADAYLFTITNWANFLKIDLQPWPAVAAYMQRIGSRPGVQAALKAEGLI